MASRIAGAPLRELCGDAATLVVTAPASRERVAPIVFRPPRPPQRGCRVGGPGAGASHVHVMLAPRTDGKDRGQDPPRCVNRSDYAMHVC